MKIDFSLSQFQRADAKAALRLIHGKNLSLEACVKIALQMEHGETVSTRAEVAVDGFLKSVLRRGKREGTFRFYYERLKWFTGQHDGTLDDWDRTSLKRALEQMPRAPTTVRMTFRAIRALYGWALRQNPMLARKNPCSGLQLDLPETVRDVKFLSVEETKRIISRVQPELLPSALLLLFGGLRPEEIAPRNHKPRLQWENVSHSERYIRVPGDVSKVSGATRIIQGLPECLWRMLPPIPSGPVCPYTADWLIRGMRAALGKKWIQDVTRHTFATYAMAVESNAGKVAEWLGHEGDLGTFHKHYKGLTSREQAELYWRIWETFVYWLPVKHFDRPMDRPIGGEHR